MSPFSNMNSRKTNKSWNLFVNGAGRALHVENNDWIMCHDSYALCNDGAP